MSLESERTYGQVSNLFVSRKADGESIIVGGMAQDSSRFARVLSKRAAQMLWFHLTRHLFPEKSHIVTALAHTASLRDPGLPTITTHATVNRQDNGGFAITGWAGEQMWILQLTDSEAHRFWTALDLALYPVGWQGRSSKE